MPALLACAAEDLSAERFAEYLALGEVPPVDPDTGAPPPKPVPWVAPRDGQLVFATLEPEPTGEPPPEPLHPAPEAPPSSTVGSRAPYRWERLIVDASAIGGRDRWARRLRGLDEELDTKARALEANQPERAAHVRDDLAALSHLERFALPLIDRPARLPGPQSGASGSLPSKSSRPSLSELRRRFSGSSRSCES